MSFKLLNGLLFLMIDKSVRLRLESSWISASELYLLAFKPSLFKPSAAT